MKARISQAKPAPAPEENDPSFRKASMRSRSKVDDESKSSVCECYVREIKGGHEICFYQVTPNSGIRLRVGKTHEGIMRAEIERFGEYSGLIVLEPGRTTPCRLHTPYGAMDISENCLDILYEPSSKGIHIELNYISRSEGLPDGSHIFDTYSIRYV